MQLVQPWTIVQLLAFVAIIGEAVKLLKL